MSRVQWLLGGLFVAGVLYVMSRTEKGQQVTAAVADKTGETVKAVSSSVTGYLLNNPLNIERGQQWQGLAADQPNARFCKFVSMTYGVRAAARLLQTYHNSYGLNTVRKIIDRFNPKSDGQPASYIPNVSAALGVNPDTIIDVSHRALLFKLVRAMMKMEIGAVASALVSDATINEGLTLANIT